jgi:hypothetical protein
MDNPERLTTYGTQDEEKQNKNTTQCVLDTTMSNQNTYLYIVRIVTYSHQIK